MQFRATSYGIEVKLFTEFNIINQRVHIKSLETETIGLQVVVVLA